MDKINYLDGSLNVVEGLKAVKYKRDFKKNHPEYFEPSGLLTFCGYQGSGKTLSLALYIFNLLKIYPKVIIVSNVRFVGLPDGTKIIYYSTINELIRLFSDVHNGYAGVIYVVDEIQTLFNNLLKRGQNVDVLEVISQQRKQRKHIVGTAQVYSRIDKVFREQMENVVICDNYFGFIQFNKTLDFKRTRDDDKDLEIKIARRHLWFHSVKLYESYDTSQIISSFKINIDNSIMSDEAFETLKNFIGGIYNGKSTIS